MTMYFYASNYFNLQTYDLFERNDVVIILQTLPNDFLQIENLRTGITFDIDINDFKNIFEQFDVEKTGDRYDKKVCDRCFKLLNTEEEFENNRLKKDNVITKRPSCRACRKNKDGKAIPSFEKRRWEEKRPIPYSLFTCPICEKRTIVGISKIVLDHNHHTGEVRGYLCESCNTGIGRFDDNPDLVNRALDWLTQR